MRFQEFILEKINPALGKENFYAEKTIDLPGVGPLTFTLVNISTLYPIQFRVDVAKPDGTKIAYFRFLMVDYDPNKKSMFGFKLADKKDPYVIGGNVSVWNEYQKKGIATAVYNWVKELGNDIRPSSAQTDQGRAMWQSFNKQK